MPESEREEQEHGSLLCSENSFVLPRGRSDLLFTMGFSSTETGEQQELSSGGFVKATTASSGVFSDLEPTRVWPLVLLFFVSAKSLLPDQSKCCVRHRG